MKYLTLILAFIVCAGFSAALVFQPCSGSTCLSTPVQGAEITITNHGSNALIDSITNTFDVNSNDATFSLTYDDSGILVITINGETKSIDYGKKLIEQIVVVNNGAEVTLDLNGEHIVVGDGIKAGYIGDSYTVVGSALLNDDSSFKIYTVNKKNSGNNENNEEFQSENLRIQTDEVPEFGVVASAIALIGAIGILVYKRKE